MLADQWKIEKPTIVVLSYISKEHNLANALYVIAWWNSDWYLFVSWEERRFSSGRVLYL